MSLKIKTHAKVNLGLYITGKRADGYHELCSLFLPVELHDVLTVSTLESKNHELKITASGSFSKQCPTDKTNILCKVLEKVRDKIGEGRSILVNIEKNIPAAAGLGGGSSNAAGFLKALNQLFELKLANEELKHIAGEIGADVPFFLDSKPALVEGIGDKITPFTVEKDYWLVIVKPAVGLATTDVYRNFTLSLTLTNTNVRHSAYLKSLSFQGLKEAEGLKRLSNDLEAVSVGLVPELSEAKDFLMSLDPVVCMMSGSGTSMFAVFDSEIKGVPGARKKDWFLCTTKVLRG
ncbi:MAG: 4-(cytidine 5'-diphospho)-2-C-methyl-D-erythritol kinase [Pseudomonadota bacterium]